MPFQPPPRRLSILASVLFATGILLAVAGCDVTPLGPTGGPEPTPVGIVRATPVGFVYKLGSPIVLQVMHGQPPTGTGGCAAGLLHVFLPPGAAPMPCFQPVGRTVTITTAAVSAVSNRSAPTPGQPASYVFMVGVLPAQVAAVTALIMQAYDSHGAVGISVGGKLWQAAQVLQPFPGQQLQIDLLSRNQALQLHQLLVPSS